MISGQWVAPAKLTLADYLVEEWLPSRSHRSGATRQQYRWAVNHLLDGGPSTTSMQTIGKVIRMALGDAVKRRIITTAQYHANPAHPLVRSYEPDENWWWCYADEIAFEVDGAPPSPSHP